MAKDINQCNFIGRLGKDVEVRYMPNSKAVASFSIACGDDYKDSSGNKIERTNWINIVIFGRLAEVAGEYLRKGSQVFISGKQTTRKWTDKNGVDRYTTEIVANEMQMLGSSGGVKASHGDGGHQTPQSAQVKQEKPMVSEGSGREAFKAAKEKMFDHDDPGISEDDIPF